MNLKTNLLKQCEVYLNQRFETIQNTILDIQNALQSETKSSAGDKHETGRAMLQLEREKAGHQLAEVQKLNEILNKVNPESIHNKCILGSIVFTTKDNYFIAISAGEITHQNQKFYAISPATPIAQLLLSKSTGDSFEFRKTGITITKIF